METTITLTGEEAADMAAIAIEHGVSIEEILNSFIADLTGSRRTRGSDERILARDYLNRAFPTREDLTQDEIDQVDALHSEAYEHRSAGN